MACRIVSDKLAQPWDIVVYPRFLGKYGNNIFMFNSDMNIVNISLEFEHNFVGGSVLLPKEPINQCLREFAHAPNERYFHDGDGYVPPNGECGIIILKYQDWKTWILKNNPLTTRAFYDFVEKKALEVMGQVFFVR